MPEFLFWFSLIFIVYTYAGYPALLYVWSRLFPKPVRKAYMEPAPMVSVVIAAGNEEKNIRAPDRESGRAGLSRLRSWR